MGGSILEVSFVGKENADDALRIHASSEALVEAIPWCVSVRRNDESTFVSDLSVLEGGIDYTFSEDYLNGQHCYVLDRAGVEHLISYLEREKVERLSKIEKELKSGKNADTWLIGSWARTDSSYYFLLDSLLYSEMAFLEDRLSRYVESSDERKMAFFGSYDYRLGR